MPNVRTILVAALLLLMSSTWWFAFDSRAPQAANDAIPLAALRAALAADNQADRPLAVELYRTGTGEAPMFAVEAGGGFGKFAMAYTAFGIRYRTGRVMIDAASDRETALAIGNRAAAHFDDAAYALLLDRILKADRIVLTHEHKDHVMAVARHPDLAALAPRLLLPEAQRYGLVRHANQEKSRDLLGALPASKIAKAVRIAPGIAVAPVSGHSPGSLVILVRLAGGREYLFVGDIAWSFNDIVTMTTRPRFLQWVMFEPNEDRDQVLRQLRALHDIHAREPALVIVPSHDDAWLNRLVANGALTLAK